MNETVSMIIPTLNAGREIQPLLEVLLQQTRPADELVVVDSSSDDDTADKVRLVIKKHPAIQLHIIERSDFNHGSTRDKALREWTTGDFVLFITQDALPANKYYIENLLKPFSNPRVGVVSGRQLPKPDARRPEQLVRSFNYPSKSFIRGKEDISHYGIKTFYTSDVCSAYRRSAYLACGGFCATMMSEDMYMAARLVAADYLVAYSSEAMVYHSHNLAPREQFQRNYSTGFFLQEHKELLMGADEVSEGSKLVKCVSTQLLREGRIGDLFLFFVDCAARYFGNRSGRAAARKGMDL